MTQTPDRTLPPREVVAAAPGLMLSAGPAAVGALLSDAIVRAEGDYAATLALGRTMARFGFVADALGPIRAAAVRHPASIDLLLLLHDLEAAKGDGSTTLPALLELSQKTGRKRHLVARRLQAGDQVLALLAAAGGEAEFELADQLARHDILLATGDQAGATAVLTALWAAHPRAAPVQRAMLRAAFASGGPVEGLARFSEMFVANYAVVSTLVNLLLSARALADAAAILTRFAAAHEAKSGFAADRCRVLLAQGNAAQAEAEFVAPRLATSFERWSFPELALSIRTATATGDLATALSRAETACRLFPVAPFLVHLHAQALFRGGDWAAGLGVLDGFLTKAPQNPDAIRFRDQYLMQIGRYDAVSAPAMADTPAARDQRRWFDLRIARLSGDLEAVAALTAAFEMPGYAGQLTILEARADAAIMAGDLAAARGLSDQAVALGPHDPGLWVQAGKLRFLGGDIEGARQAREAFGAVATPDEDGLAPTDTPDLVLSEITADNQAAAVFAACATRDPDARLGHLLQVGIPDPHLASSWMPFTLAYVFSTLGRFEAKGAADRIPHQLMTYWEAAEPEPVASIRQAWAKALPGYTHQSFDKATAQAWLADHATPVICAAFDGCDSPAMRADVFRLAWLAAVGGVYVDIDEWPRSAVTDWLHHADLVLCHEKGHSTFGNHFIAAIPDHPVLRAALSALSQTPPDARGLAAWMATGPGFLTRIAGTWIFEQLREAGPVCGLRVLRHAEYCGRVSSTLNLPHKFSAAHWRN